MSHLLRGVRLSRRSCTPPRGFPARFAARSFATCARDRTWYVYGALCNREERERRYIRSTIVIDRSRTTLSMRRIFSRVIFKSLSTQARVTYTVPIGIYRFHLCQLSFVSGRLYFARRGIARRICIGEISDK